MTPKTKTPDPVAPPDEFDPFASASDPVVQSYDLFGKVEISAWACALVKGQGKVPYDPQAHDRRYTAIDVFIQPLPEIDVKYPRTLEEHWIAEFAEWAKITLPSIRDNGYPNVRDINGKWARVARVPNGKKYEKKDASGNPTGEMRDETTFRFVAFFDTEDECRAAYTGAGGQPANGSNGHAPKNPADQDKATALAFLKVIVQNAARGKSNLEEAQAAVTDALAQYPTVGAHFDAESPEAVELINAALKA